MTRQSKRTDTQKVMPILAAVLGDEMAAAIIEHRDIVIRIPLTETAARLQAKEYLKTGNPVAAAEMQILMSWRAIRADWFFNELRKQQQPHGYATRSVSQTPFQQRHQTAIDAFDRKLGLSHDDFANDATDFAASDFSPH